MKVIGLMSGTSADGIEAVRVHCHSRDERGASLELEVEAHRHVPYPPEVRKRVLCAMRGEADTAELCQLNFDVGESFAQAALTVLDGAELVASHGQTVYHIPGPDAGRGWDTRSTLQLGESSVIAQRVHLPVIADFRVMDLACGGQAAPLVPFADHLRYARADRCVAVHNLGGISNVTYLPSTDPADVLAFDTGPANCLMDEVAQSVGQPCDEGGQLAARGRIDEQLVAGWLADPYFSQPPPKSTGRERFFLRALPGLGRLPLEDQAASVTWFVAKSIELAYRRHLPRLPDDVLLAGGGVHNRTLVGHLQRLLPECAVQALPAEEAATREAAAFAVMGYYAWRGWPNVLPAATGAARAVIAGKLVLDTARPFTGTVP